MGPAAPLRSELMGFTPRQGSLLLLSLLALIAGGVMIARTVLDRRPVEPEEPASASEPLDRSTREPAPGPLQTRLEDPLPGTLPEGPGRDPVPDEILCLHYTELRPIAGIRLYREEEPIAGPTTREGILRLAPGPPRPLTVWGAGWVPVDLPRPPYPDRVLLTPAKSILEVRLLNLELEQRVVRTQLQPHAPTVARTGPWQPELERVAEDRYQTPQLTPGTYDVYFWVARGRGAPRVFEAREVEVPAGQLTQTTLDIAAPSASDEEADS